MEEVVVVVVAVAGAGGGVRKIAQELPEQRERTWMG